MFELIAVSSRRRDASRARRRATERNGKGGSARMRRIQLIMMIGLATGITSCDFLDPSKVTNPTVTEERFIDTPEATSVWIRGVERQLASTINQVVMATEVVSDNVFNNRTLFSKVFDIPRIEPEDFDVTNLQEAIHRLRTMAKTGLEKVYPNDESATQEHRALLHLHRAFASLLAAENFVALPGEPMGEPLTPAQHLALAIADFEEARAVTSDEELAYSALLGIARAHYQGGARAAAVDVATEVVANAPQLVRFVEFDVTDGPTNQMQFAIFDSGQGEFQPLPRLDFLFPKYFSLSANDQSPIAILKGEEAFLILAEARIAAGDLDGGRAALHDLLDLIELRPKGRVNDSGQERGRNGGTWIFPNSADVLVAASPDDDPRAGLVLTRNAGPIQVPTISGTSVTREMIDAATEEVELLELLYLMRQEIFILEGRRMTDLGIRFPIAYREAQINPHIDFGSEYLKAQIPDFIPLDYGLDSFTYTEGDTLVVIHHNMNRRIVENLGSDFVLPFH